MTGIRGVLTRNSVTRFFLDDSSLSARLDDSGSTFGLVLTGGRVAIRNEFVLATNSHGLVASTERSKVGVILTGIGGVFTRNSIAVLFLDDRSLSSRLSDTNGALWLVLTRSRVLIRNKLVFAADSHVLIAVTKGLKVTIILTRVRSIFTRNSVTRLFLDNSSVTARHGHTDSTLGLVLTRSGVAIRDELIFATDGHSLVVGAERSEVSVILARVRSVFSGDSVAILLLDHSSITARLGNADGTFRFVLTRRRVAVGDELVLATDRHSLIVGTERSEVGVILTRIRRVLAGDLVTILLLDNRSLSSGLSNANCALRLILARSRVLVGHKLVLATNGHVSFVMAESLEVTIVLAGVRSVLSRDPITVLFLDHSSVTARLGNANSALRLILTRSRVLVRYKLVLAANRHGLIVGAERSEMGVILAGIRGVFTRHSVAVFFFNDRSLGSRLSDANSALRLILARSGILVRHELILATNRHSLIVSAERCEVGAVLARIRRVLTRDLVAGFFFDVGSLGTRLDNCSSTLRFVLTRSRIAVRNELILATNRDVLLASFEVSSAEWLDVTVVLARIGRILSRHSVAVLFLNDSSLSSWLSDTDGAFRLILARSRILVRHELVFTTNCHGLIKSTEGSEMSIILTGVGRVFAGDPVSILFLDNGSVAARLSDADSAFRLVLSRRGVRVRHKLIFTANSHLLFIVAEGREVTIILTRVGCVLSWHSIAMVFLDEGSLAAG